MHEVLEAQAKRLNDDALQLAVMRDRTRGYEGHPGYRTAGLAAPPLPDTSSAPTSPTARHPTPAPYAFPSQAQQSSAALVML